MSQAGHRTTERWLHDEVETLADLLRPGLRAVCVGINPAPRSVRAGHYYQGNLGQKFFRRLQQAGAVPPGRGGWHDDEAFAGGVGFTDIVKRPTNRATEVRLEEFEHGQGLLEAKLAKHCPALVIFTFKQAARKVFGQFEGNGFVPGLELSQSRVFVMPGPYEPASTATATLGELAEYFSGERRR